LSFLASVSLFGEAGTMEGLRRAANRFMPNENDNLVNKTDGTENPKKIPLRTQTIMGKATIVTVLGKQSKRDDYKPYVELMKENVKEEDLKTPTTPFATFKTDKANLITAEEFLDIGKCLSYLERLRALPKNFLEGSIVTPRTRLILVDWMMLIQERFGLEHETFHIGVTILDRCLYSMKHLKKNQLQLLAASCMFLASKYEEVSIPHAGDFAYLADNIFTTKDIIRMESEIFAAVNFNVNFVVAITFLRRYRYFLDNGKEAHGLSKMIVDLAYLDGTLCTKLPSVIAMCADYLAYRMLNLVFPATAFELHGFTQEQILAESASFVDPLISFLNNKKESALRRKYSSFNLKLTPSQKEKLLSLKNH